MVARVVRSGINADMHRDLMLTTAHARCESALAVKGRGLVRQMARRSGRAVVRWEDEPAAVSVVNAYWVPESRGGTGNALHGSKEKPDVAGVS